jgi:hypothetical protein
MNNLCSHLGLAVVLLGLAQGCSNQPRENVASKGVGAVPYYEMSEQRRREFVSGLAMLPRGAKYREVIARLGRPDSDTVLRGKTFDAPVTGRVVTYYLKRHDPELVNVERDQYVHVRFDNDGVMAEIAGNVPEVTNSWRGGRQ